ncbi:GNAT family N-acetyltransferase [Fructilactobacillus sp. Tb1]|uniref:GNAT family N-acetyltransferase n=1 Tax=Fructilactobacillus sp. Tb1 TaxID=3422304 RepID=UPI003D2B6DB9
MWNIYGEYTMKFEFRPGKFYIEENNETVAEIIYTVGYNLISINHTFVSPNYRNQGLAGKLMLQVINYAQEKQFLINPVCSFAKNFFKKNPQYDYLLQNNFN